MKENFPQKDKLKSVAGIINASMNFVLTCHVMPDVDAVGSMLALGCALKGAGKDVVLYIEDRVPEGCKFLPGSSEIVHIPPDDMDKSTLIILDCNNFSRIGKRHQARLLAVPVAVFLDHHLVDSGSSGWDVVLNLSKDENAPHRPKIYSYIDHKAFATGAVVFWLMEEMGWPLTQEIATNLYAAIVSDTGGFRYSNTNITTFQMAETLVRHGADPYSVSNALFECYSIRRQQLLAMVLKTLEVKMNGKAAIMHVTPEMFNQVEATEDDAKDFISYARCIDTVEIAIFIKEFRSGQVYVSLRSKTFFNVSEFAQEFGGGGHYHASGFSKTGTVFEIREKILESLGKRGIA
jgi:phosphoesterase RecJ-like protein